LWPLVIAFASCLYAYSASAYAVIWRFGRTSKINLKYR
jgi:hypothetical protein